MCHLQPELLAVMKRPSNKPREEIERLARQAIELAGGANLARAWFKFTCGHCGSRETAPTPNLLPLFGVCTVCQAETPIRGAGFALETRKDRFFNWDNPPSGSKALVIRRQYASDKGDA
jgi:hypothetical protein